MTRRSEKLLQSSMDAARGSRTTNNDGNRQGIEGEPSEESTQPPSTASKGKCPMSVDSRPPKRTTKRSHPSSKPTTRGEGSSSQRKKSKPTAVDNSGEADLFMNDEIRLRYNLKFRGCTIQFGRCVDFGFFNKYGFRLEVLFRAIGWFDFLNRQQVMYPRLVRCFYAHLKMNSKTVHCTSYVKGVHISLNCTTLNHLLGLPQFDTFKAFHTHTWAKYDGFDQEEALQEMCLSNNVNASRPPLYSELNVEARIMHSILSYCILPRVGSRVHVGYFDVFIMWCIMHGQKLDLAHLIIHHMAYCAPRAGVLPYGMMLTTIFEHFKVPLDDEGDVFAARPTDIYSASTLKRMGFELDANNTWVIPRDEDEQDEPGDSPPTDPPTDGPTDQPPPPPGLQVVMDAILSTREVVEKGLSDVNSWLGRLENRVSDMHGRLLGMENRVTTMGRKISTVEDDVHMMKFYGGEVYNAARVMSEAFETWHGRGRDPPAQAPPPGPPTNAMPYQATFPPVFPMADNPPPPRNKKKTGEQDATPSTAPTEYVEHEEHDAE